MCHSVAEDVKSVIVAKCLVVWQFVDGHCNTCADAISSYKPCQTTSIWQKVLTTVDVYSGWASCELHTAAKGAWLPFQAANIASATALMKEEECSSLQQHQSTEWYITNYYFRFVLSWPFFQRSLQVRLGTMMVSQRTSGDCWYRMFYRPDALPVSQPTVSKHWRAKS